MKKCLFTALAIGAFGVPAFAQTIPNAGFEQWHNYTIVQAGGLVLEVPNTWSGMDSMLAAISPMATLAGYSYTPNKQVFKSTDAHSGTYATEIRTVDFGGFLGSIPAIFSNAKPKIDFVGMVAGQPQNFVDILDYIDFEQGTPITKRVDEVAAWVKMSDNSVEEGVMIALVGREENGEFTISGGGMQGVDPTQTQYDEIKIKLEYDTDEVEPGNEPNSLVVIFLSSSPDNDIFTEENTLFIDDVSFTYVDTTVSIKVPMFAHKGFQVFPNPAKDKVTIFNKGTESMKGKLVVTDIVGRSVANEDLLPSGNVLHVSGWAKGLYNYVIQDENGAGVQSGKFVVD